MAGGKTERGGSKKGEEKRKNAQKSTAVHRTRPPRAKPQKRHTNKHTIKTQTIKKTPETREKEQRGGRKRARGSTARREERPERRWWVHRCVYCFMSARTMDPLRKRHLCCSTVVRSALRRGEGIGKESELSCAACCLVRIGRELVALAAGAKVGGEWGEDGTEKKKKKSRAPDAESCELQSG